MLVARRIIIRAPLEVVIYNFSPLIRTQLKHVLSLGVIPGPREPKNMNSFLFPIYAECIQGAIGISALKLDAFGDLQRFQLHFYLIFVFSDIKAVIKARCTKGPNSVCPCHECKIKGTRDPGNPRVTTHYVPHTLPGEVNSQIQGLLNDPKTHEWYMQVYLDIENADSQAERQRILKAAGVNGVPIIGMLPSIDIAKSMPYGFMHQMFLNTFPNLCRHWQGVFKNIDARHERYHVSDKTWELIGEETINANATIPSSMVRLLPDIYTDRGHYNAESWYFWMVWVSPYVLKGRLDEEFYNHHLRLVDFVKDCTASVITPEMLRKINNDIHYWHADYER